MRTFDRDEFQLAGHRIIDLIAEYFDEIERRRVAPDVEFPKLLKEFAQSVSDEGIGLAAGVEELSDVFAASMAMSHPLYLGLVNSSPLPQAVLGDLVVSALDNNGGASHQGPAGAAAEREVIRWMSAQLGYEGDGMILPGGTHATLQGLQIAKFCRFPKWIEQGPHALNGCPRIYLSSATHFSSARAARVIGLGDDCIVPVADQGRGEMDPSALHAAIQEDVKQGRQPFAVVATGGTTGTGAIDSLRDIVPVCQQFNIWLHVDACYGGAAAMLESYRSLFAGLEQADSVAVDLHKWFFMPLTAGVLLTRHEQSARALFDVAASYIPASGDAEPYSRGLPTSRRATGLAAWFGLRTAGWNVVKEAIERNIRLTRDLERQLERRGFRVMPEGCLSIACARWEPAGWDAEASNQLQESIAEEVRRQGAAWFATTHCHGESWLRFNAVNLHTQQEHIDQLAVLVADAAQRVAHGRG